MPKVVEEGIHDDYSVNAILAAVDPGEIRFEERRVADRASINAQSGESNAGGGGS